MIDIKDITPGDSYACKYRVVTMLNSAGLPNTSLKIGEAGGTPALYESLGVLMQRDLDNKCVRVKDVDTGVEFVVPFQDIWDVDTVDWATDDC